MRSGGSRTKKDFPYCARPDIRAARRGGLLIILAKSMDSGYNRQCFTAIV